MFFWASSGFQPSVKVSQTFLILPAVEVFLEHFHHALEQEGGVRIALVALDEGEVAFGLALLEHCLGHQAAHADVVERHVERIRIFDEHVIGQSIFTPASRAALKDGRMASESKATTRMTSTFWRDQAFDVGEPASAAEPCASVET